MIHFSRIMAFTQKHYDEYPMQNLFKASNIHEGIKDLVRYKVLIVRYTYLVYLMSNLIPFCTVLTHWNQNAWDQNSDTK